MFINVLMMVPEDDGTEKSVHTLVNINNIVRIEEHNDRCTLWMIDKSYINVVTTLARLYERICDSQQQHVPRWLPLR